jgi:hypothetical protein
MRIIGFDILKYLDDVWSGKEKESTHTHHFGVWSDSTIYDLTEFFVSPREHEIDYFYVKVEFVS